MTPGKDRAERWAAFLALGLVGLFFLGVNTFPIVTNDSLGYLDHSRDLAGEGLVRGGYRQIGYPITLAVGRFVSGFVGVEPLLFSALAQRLVLAAALGYAVWLWRWRAAPVVLLVLTPGFLLYPNFLLTEGLSVPLSLLLACVVSHHFQVVAGKAFQGGREMPDGQRQPSAFSLAVVGTVITLLLLTLRFPLAVFGLVPVVFLGAAVRRSDRQIRTYGILIVTFALVAGAFSAGLSAENHNEFGVAFPSTQGEPSQYWGAWVLTFRVHPENQQDAALAKFWDGGSYVPRLIAVAREYPDYRVWAEVIDGDIDEMLGLAGLDRGSERLFSVLGALRGGRIDDLHSYTATAVHTDARSIDVAINRNTFTLNNGVHAFAERYNEGMLPQAMITSPVFPSSPAPGIQSILGVLLPLALIGLLVFSIIKRQWWLGVVYLVPVIVLGTAMGWLLLDLVRFLLPGSVYGIAGFCALWDTPRSPKQTDHAYTKNLVRSPSLDEASPPDSN